MKLHRNSLLSAAAVVLVPYLVCLVVGLPTWAAIALTVVLLVLLAVVWKQPDPPRPVATPTASPPSLGTAGSGPRLYRTTVAHGGRRTAAVRIA
jgi:hypothetical protein